MPARTAAPSATLAYAQRARAHERSGETIWGPSGLQPVVYRALSPFQGLQPISGPSAQLPGPSAHRRGRSARAASLVQTCSSTPARAPGRAPEGTPEE
eukprot:5461756-Alexandrium_andersonii.AAC.1